MHVDFRIIIIRLFEKMSPSASRRCLQVKRVPMEDKLMAAAIIAKER
jgi:hypothetical protein